MSRLTIIAVLAASAGCLGEFRVGGEGAEGGGTDTDTDTDTGAEECGVGLSRCGTGCVDLSTNHEHCGQCDKACSVDLSCSAGTCIGECEANCDQKAEICAGDQCLCRSGFTRCGGLCVDLDSNPSHCGECSKDCGTDVCDRGECAAGACQEEGTNCSGACVDIDEHPLHCGGCEQPCDADQLCVKGDCRDFSPANCQSDDNCSGGSKCCADEEMESMICIEGDECP